MPEHEREAWFKRNPLRGYTPNTITDRKKLEREISRIGELGYALDNEEHEPHVRCVAAPIYDYAGNAAAAISITVPSVRMTQGRLPELTQTVKETADKISAQLGYRIDASTIPRATKDAKARRIGRPDSQYRTSRLSKR